ncbi:hypothetical protein MY1884_002099 [Beauveria asiatica]
MNWGDSPAPIWSFDASVPGLWSDCAPAGDVQSANGASRPQAAESSPRRAATQTEKASAPGATKTAGCSSLGSLSPASLSRLHRTNSSSSVPSLTCLFRAPCSATVTYGTGPLYPPEGG